MSLKLDHSTNHPQFDIGQQGHRYCCRQILSIAYMPQIDTAAESGSSVLFGSLCIDALLQILIVGVYVNARYTQRSFLRDIHVKRQFSK